MATKKYNPITPSLRTRITNSYAEITTNVPKLPKLSRGAVNPQVDDLLAAISKYGGLSREAAIKFGIDPAEFNNRAHSGMVIFPKTGGLSSDEMVVRLSQDGYPVGKA